MRIKPGPTSLLFLFVGVLSNTSLTWATELTDTADQKVERPSVGLVLSGGGARGGAHVGVIKILEELRIPIDYIAGTSMGAIVGGLYASGMSASDLENIITTADWSELLADRPPRAERSFRRKADDFGFLVDFEMGVNKSGLLFPEGIVQGQNLAIALKHWTLPVAGIKDFDQLPIPFRAVAADIISGEAVTLDSGDLATAIRASMSAPGVFKPVHIDDNSLVDGGIANNLPVQIVKDMGAEFLIVVDVGFPLLEASELKSALAITKQMLTIMIKARSEDQIALMSPRDILIRPDLGNLGSQDFNRSEEAMMLGKAKTEEYLDELAKLSISQQAYFSYREDIIDDLSSGLIIDKVEVVNESKLSPEVIKARLKDQTGQPLDVKQLETDISNIYGLDTFESVSYDIVQQDDVNTLKVYTAQKSWGPNYLQFGINLEDDFDGNSDYNIAARFTKTEINKSGGEFRAEVQIGASPSVFAEFYQPLDYGSRWFINPQVTIQSSSDGLFNEGNQLALFRSDLTAGLLEGGYHFGNWGEFRAGLFRGVNKGKVQIGPPEFEDSSFHVGAYRARFAIDTIDKVAIPRSGTNFTAAWTGNRENLGSDATFDLAQVFLLKPQTWGKNTFLHWWEYGTTFNDQTSNSQPYTLGGLFSLTGYAPGELAGKYYGMGRLLYYRRLGEQALSVLNTSVYVGASLEVGNVWQHTNDISFDNTLTAGSVFVVFDTLLGPIYLAYGVAEGGRKSGYLFLGQTF